MGAAVPVAEPEWSGAHKGICLYLARLLQVWGLLKGLVTRISHGCVG